MRGAGGESETQSPAGRGGDEGVGDSQIINQDTIWDHGALETPTTVSTATVLPRGPCAPPEGWPQLRRGRKRVLCTNQGSSFRHTHTHTHTSCLHFHQRKEGGHIQSKSIFTVTKVTILHKMLRYFFILEHQALFMGSRKKSWIEKWILFLPYCCSQLKLSKEE